MVAISSEVATCLSRLITVLSGILTPIIAVIVTCISWQQYKVNKRQHTLALFKKRFAVFIATNKFIRAIMDGKVDLDTMNAFSVETAQHEFLFEKDIKDYLDELFKMASGIYELKARKQSGSFAPEDREELSKREIEFKKQGITVGEKFLKYIDFRKP